MILQSLVRHYDALAAGNLISPAGWCTAKVSLALRIAPDGTLLNVISLKVPSKNGKKEVPQPMQVPEQVKKTSGVAANFLCDNGSYLLGIDDKGKPERTQKCFEAAKELHHAVLDHTESEAAKAVLHFFDTWDINTTAENEKLTDYLDEIEAGANLVFEMPDGTRVHEDSAVRTAWEQYHTKIPDDAVRMRCLVTGEEAPIARLHPSIKGINGAQPSGASLVSYNAPAFESYDHTQGLNAPVSEIAAFKYGTALNYMTADRDHIQHIADTTVLYWTEGAEPLEQDIWNTAVFGSDSKVTEADLKGIIDALANGGSTIFQDTVIQYDTPFYVLGLAPNASRLSVRFFLQNKFGRMLQNLMEHNERLKIIQPMGETHELPLWTLLNETANQNSKNKAPPAPMAAAVLTSILMGTDYPSSLFENVMLRIRAEHDINWKKAAIIKAYFLKNKEITIPEEVLKVELNKDSDYMPYVLGRLFAVLEMVQKTATPGIKATIRNKYFTSASATPSTIFPLLLSLSQHHQRKLSEGSKIYYDKIITELENRIHKTLPTRFSLQEQGAFYLGYYHEKQDLFTSKKEKENSKAEEDN
ncbi:type I-C CRISPR-associated protein Cas8c/Csd1 [Caproicibacterium lactatifermentans]|jgi:CRISPR-associated protein Csd1|uniref:type I-C CRISPR-associated protein Cas8c/Csd1 n=1 Tax=Caproicibacterium lactatifermentans TaxID=2666138 RepID=UPI003D8FE2DA